MALQNPSLKKIAEHYTNIWASTPSYFQWRKGPWQQLPDEFCVLEFPATNKSKMWTYATCGMSRQADSNKLELHLFAPSQAHELIELLTVVAHYHLTGVYLGLGHTVNFGQPWLTDSECEYGLLSHPYLDGPRLEYFELESDTIQFLWLIPISLAERNFKMIHGQEALEKQFESQSFNYLDPLRKSVV